MSSFGPKNNLPTTPIAETNEVVGVNKDQIDKLLTEPIEDLFNVASSSDTPEELAAQAAEVAATANILTSNKIPGVAVVSEKQVKGLDFTKISESDIYNFDVPIEAITHELPDYLKCELRDKNYEPRWVNSNPQWIGPRIAAGFTYVVEADLEKGPSLEIKTDESGHFKFIDVVLMKIHKSRYFGQIKANYLRGERMTKKAEAQAIGASQADSFLSTYGGSQYAQAKQERQMTIYKPGV